MKQFSLADDEKIVAKADGVVWGKGIRASLKGLLILTDHRLLFVQEIKTTLAILFGSSSAYTDYRCIHDLELSEIKKESYVSYRSNKSIINVTFGADDSYYFYEINCAERDWVALIESQRVACA